LLAGRIPKEWKKYFWDCNFEKLREETQKYDQYIILRILDYGSLEDVIELEKIYSRKQIVECIKNRRGLTPRTRMIWKVWFQVDE